MSEEDFDIGAAVRATRAALKYERLAKDLRNVEAENKAQRAELARQAKEMRRIWDMTMVVMETTRAIQVIMQLEHQIQVAHAAQLAVNPWTMAIGIFMLGALVGLDAYYASKLVGG